MVMNDAVHLDVTSCLLSRAACWCAFAADVD